MTAAGEASSKKSSEQDPYDFARAIVLRQLTMAPRSRHQLEEKLRAKDCDDDVANAVLDRLSEVGLVDDDAYAGMLVRSQQLSRGLSRRGIAQELRKKGISEEISLSALEHIDHDSERDRARELVAKKLRSMHGLDAVVQTRRLAGMLARKGYSSSISWQVIREVLDESEEHRRD